MNRIVLVTGTGRSGTKYTSSCLQQGGVEAFHEILGRDGVVCWKHLMFASQFQGVVHQVRNPLNGIGSMQTFAEGSFQLMENYLNVRFEGSRLRRCMQAWVLWNRRASAVCNWRFRVEDLDKNYRKLIYFFHEVTGREFKAMAEGFKFPGVATDCHTRADRYTPVMAADLEREDAGLWKEVRDMGREYGYNI